MQIRVSILRPASEDSSILLQGDKQKGTIAAAEAQGIQCASAVAAVSATAAALGAFLAPQLPRALGVLLDGRALAASAHGISALAAAARATLAAAVPPRLLLPPLYAHLATALQVHPCALALP